jgi:hypothetical protein
LLALYHLVGRPDPRQLSTLAGDAGESLSKTWIDDLVHQRNVRVPREATVEAFLQALRGYHHRPGDSRGRQRLEISQEHFSLDHLRRQFPGEYTLLGGVTRTGLRAECDATDSTTKGATTNDLPLGIAAWDRASTIDMARPPDAVRVREARPRLLGVHASIQVDPAAIDQPPYVPRDLDANLDRKITVAAEQGGFVLLIGRSSVGKSRSLFEAVKAKLPEWWLLHPADSDEFRTFIATPTPRTVVWLDELERYLDHPNGLLAGGLKRLIIAGVVVVATLWSDEYALRTAQRSLGQPESYAKDQQLLDLAEVIEVPDALSQDERRRAEARSDDRRIRIALDTPDAGFTQVLAAGPELVRRWESAPDRECFGRAVISAALDARRVGARGPLHREFLAAAAPGYLTPDQQAKAPEDWLDRALAYATEPLRGAASPLTRVPAGMGQIAGFNVADYLYQYALQILCTVQTPEIVWQALLEHHHPDDTGRLGDSAARFGCTEFAIAFYRELASAGDGLAACLASDLLIEQGRIDEAMAVLRPNADHHRYAAERLADLLFQQRRIDELRERAVHDWTGRAGGRLMDLLVEQDRSDEAIKLALQRVDAGYGFAILRLGDLLAEHGRPDELRQRAEAGDPDAARLLDLLVEHEGQRGVHVDVDDI